MKYLLLLALFAFVAFLAYRRLRPYIAAARRVLGFVRDARSLGSDAPRGSAGRAGERLVRCGSCDTWLPASRALALRNSTTVYCSNVCLERAANAPLSRQRSIS
ncbi:MAG: hypothetical protein ACJ741_19210 [Pyrinomonadaceae bacterium]